MLTTFLTKTEWDEALWKRIEPVYREAFPHGAKPEAILRGILEHGIGFLHAGLDEAGEAVAMAVTGIVGEDAARSLLIDYIAVRRDLRGQGVGGRFLDLLTEWAQREHGVHGAVIEIEAEDTPENAERQTFWERHGFRPTDYVHQYIWVPEPYRAMSRRLDGQGSLPEDGKALFRYITSFHEKAYRRR